MSKQEMKANGIESPNMYDSLMMSLFQPPTKQSWDELNYPTMSIV